MPFKLNQDRRHHIPRQRHKVTNWPAYEASLRQRGSLTVWFTEEAIAAWNAEPRKTRGGQPWYSPLAILTALTLRAVFHLAFRQTEGLIGSIIGLLGLTLRVPDHTTMSRRAANLEVPRPQRHLGGSDAAPIHFFHRQVQFAHQAISQLAHRRRREVRIGRRHRAATARSHLRSHPAHVTVRA